MNTIIVVAPHPDDETLGCGGVILKHKKNKSKVYWLIVTSAKESDSYTKDFVKSRKHQINEITNYYGFDDVFSLDYPTTQLDTVPLSKIITDISEIFSKVKPDTLYIPHGGDVHTDHRIVFDACLSCAKWFRQNHIKKIMSYETLSETNFSKNSNNYEFKPAVYSDISQFIDKKIEAMNIYNTEVGKHPFPRSKDSIKSLAMLRGSECGYEYAEAFMLIKEIL